MKLLDLTLSNFKCYDENVHFDFTQYEDNENVLLLGINQDESGADSNLTGKTTLLDAISWLYFKKTIDGVNQDELIRRGEDWCKVEGNFLTDAGEKLWLSRYRGEKNQFSFSVNGIIMDQTTDNATQKKLLHYLGYADDNAQYFRDFYNTTYFSADALQSFTSRNTSTEERMGLISRFLNLRLLDKSSDEAKFLRIESERLIQATLTTIETLKQKMIREDEGRVMPRGEELGKTQEVEIRTNEDLTGLKDKLNQYNDRIKIIEQIKSLENEVQITLNKTDTLLQEYAQQLIRQNAELEIQRNNKIELEKVEANLLAFPTNLNTTIDFHTKEFNVFQTKLNDATQCLKQQTDLRAHYERLLSNTNWACPNCETNLMFLDDKLKRFDSEDIQKNINDISNAIIIMNNNVSEVNADIDKKDLILHDLKVKFEQKIVLEARLPLLKVNTFEQVEIAINNIKNRQHLETEKFKTYSADKHVEISELNKQLDDDSVKLINIDQLKIEITEAQSMLVNLSRLKGSLETQIETRQNDTVEIQRIEKESENTRKDYEQWLYIEKAWKTVRKLMIKNFLPEFENKINHYLDLFEIGYQIRLETDPEKLNYKTDEDRYKNKFEIKIIDSKQRVASYESLSEGGKKRVAVCVGFALRHLTLNKGYSNFEFILLDEIADKMDSVGMNLFFDMLHKISGLKIVVSHDNQLKNRFKHTITVIKEDDKTTILNGRVKV